MNTPILGQNVRYKAHVEAESRYVSMVYAELKPSNFFGLVTVSVHNRNCDFIYYPVSAVGLQAKAEISALRQTTDDRRQTTDDRRQTTERTLEEIYYRGRIPARRFCRREKVL